MTVANNTLWMSKAFTQSYRTLDEVWRTKTQLYREIATIVDAKASDFAYPLNILDLGGGLGTLASITETCFKSQRIKTWVVYDVSQEMMRAGSTFKRRNLPWLSFIQGDTLQKFAFGSNQFDIVVSVNVLYQFADDVHQHQIAVEIARVLKPGGYLIATNPLPEAENSKIIREEIRLRRQMSGLARAGASVVLDVITNLPFLFSQHRLLESANKKLPDEWIKLYVEDTSGQLESNWMGVSQAYAGQAGIWIMKKRKERL